MCMVGCAYILHAIQCLHAHMNVVVFSTTDMIHVSVVCCVQYAHQYAYANNLGCLPTNRTQTNINRIWTTFTNGKWETHPSCHVAHNGLYTLRSKLQQSMDIEGKKSILPKVRCTAYMQA